MLAQLLGSSQLQSEATNHRFNWFLVLPAVRSEWLRSKVSVASPSASQIRNISFVHLVPSDFEFVC